MKLSVHIVFIVSMENKIIKKDLIMLAKIAVTC